MDAKVKRDIVFELKKIKSFLDRNVGPGMNYFSEITPHIYICNYVATVNVDTLKKYKITNVINISGDPKDEKVMYEYKRKKIKEWLITVGDSPTDKIDDYFADTYEYIYTVINNGGVVAIHGQDSVSRAPAIIAYYLLRRYYIASYKNEEIQDELISNRYYLLDIIKYIKEIRQCIHPNPGFIEKLLFAEYRLKKEFESYIIPIKIEKELQENQKKKMVTGGEGVKEGDEKKDEKEEQLPSEASESEDLGFAKTDDESSVDLYGGD